MQALNVKFIYTGKVDEAVLKEFALSLLALAEMYDLQGLKDLAEVELVNKLDKENMVEMISIGEHHKADQLLEAALKYTKANIAWLRGQVRLQSNYFLKIVLTDDQNTVSHFPLYLFHTCQTVFLTI